MTTDELALVLAVDEEIKSFPRILNMRVGDYFNRPFRKGDEDKKEVVARHAHKLLHELLEEESGVEGDTSLDFEQLTEVRFENGFNYFEALYQIYRGARVRLLVSA